MLDLASAIVELGAAAQDRRNARRELRAAVETVVREMLKHLRTGDMAIIADQDNEIMTLMVERVTWPVYAHPAAEPERMLHPKGDVTLAMYPGVENLDEDVLYRGAALIDVRKGITLVRNPESQDETEYDVDGLMERMPRGSDNFEGAYTAELHPATDEELLFFASRAETVIVAFLGSLQGTSMVMRDAASRLVRLTPR